MIEMKDALIAMFICFGAFAMVSPGGISGASMMDSYQVEDLIRGWGIYAVTIGLLLLYPESFILIVFTCLLVSIVWHLEMMCRRRMTAHHVQACVANLVGMLMAGGIGMKLFT